MGPKVPQGTSVTPVSPSVTLSVAPRVTPNVAPNLSPKISAKVQQMPGRVTPQAQKTRPGPASKKSVVSAGNSNMAPNSNMSPKPTEPATVTKIAYHPEPSTSSLPRVAADLHQITPKSPRGLLKPQKNQASPNTAQIGPSKISQR